MTTRDNKYFLLSIYSTDLMMGGFDERFKSKAEALLKLDEYRLMYPGNFSATLCQCKDLLQVERTIRLPKKRARP